MKTKAEPFFCTSRLVHTGCKGKPLAHTPTVSKKTNKQKQTIKKLLPEESKNRFPSFLEANEQVDYQ